MSVVGGGVVGLSVAHELAEDGHRVTVVADLPAARTVSAVAAAIWFPYGTGQSASVTQWSERTLLRLAGLSADPAAGVDMRPGTVVERHAATDRTWTGSVPEHREATAAELPAGAAGGVRATVPVLSMDVYLPWLTERCRDLGVVFSHRRVTSVDDLVADADLVVVAAGLRSGELLGDETVFPVRGQVVRLPNPGLHEWFLDEDDPAGLTYVVPRRDDVVCGGVAERDAWSDVPDPDTERAVLQRATGLVPALAGLPVLSRAVGLRPGRAAVRLEHVASHALPVVACYGHGGAGVTLSWGCAEAVAALVRGCTVGRTPPSRLT